MAEIAPTQLFALTESVGSDRQRIINPPAVKHAMAQAVKAEEVAAGVDQNRNSVGFSTEIAQYELHATGSLNFALITAAHASMMEGIIRSARPSSIYCGCMTSVRIVMAGEFNADLYFVNSIHLDYAERFLPVPENLEYSVISRQDSEAGSFPRGFDVSIIDATSATRNPEMLNALISNAPRGGIVLLSSSLDQGMFPRYGQSHDFWPMFNELASRDDVAVYHIPLSLGISVITKL